MEPTAGTGGGEGGIWRRSRMNRFMCTQMWGIYVLSLSLSLSPLGLIPLKHTTIYAADI